MRFQIERYPRISVVTPSFNQGAYLGETLASVASQHYPELELIVMDGGSTDDSVEVIKSFASCVTYWESQPDQGQSHAINKGFAKATGDIVCWLNSDDVFLPGALNAVAHAFNSHPDWEWVSAPSLKFGDGLHEVGGLYELPHDRVEWLRFCPLAQPSTFWKRSLYDRLGGLDESFHFALDYEYWVRFVFGGASVHFMDRPLSAYRLHDVSKTISSQEKFRAEEERLREKYWDKLTRPEQRRLARLVSQSEDVLELTRSVALMQAKQWDDARKGVLSVLRRSPSMIFTKAGAASLYRVLAKKPRYNE
jgi:glycosyltransferase involved in cell wall biosynthesis